VYVIIVRTDLSFFYTTSALIGYLIIQDKASCFPAQILCNHWLSGDIIDACAAPGNKTSQLGMFLYQQQEQEPQSPFVVYAFDRDEKRALSLSQRMIHYQLASNQLPSKKRIQEYPIIVEQQDFLTVNVFDPKYAHVQSILVDPSCSGSGIVRNAIDRILERDKQIESADSQDRIKQLHAFQCKALWKAMSFPAVDLIVYSTCSIHQLENEGTVNEVLHYIRQHSEEFGTWEVASPIGFESWHRRGEIEDTSNHNAVTKTNDNEDDGTLIQLSSKEIQCLIRCAPEDGMNGFFVAVFKRTSPPTKMPITSFLNTMPSKSVEQNLSKKANNRNLVEHAPFHENLLTNNKNTALLSSKKRKQLQHTSTSTNNQQQNIDDHPTKKKAKYIETTSQPANNSFFPKLLVSKRQKKKFGRK
jgi:16S rRNA C967 or C1407 C5-methylase (RsmB/RsmF family)